MNKAVYIDIYVNEMNNYADHYEFVAIYSVNFDQVTLHGNFQMPVNTSNTTTKVIMKLKKTAELLYGVTNENSK